MNIFEIYRNHVLAAAEEVAPGYKTEAITLEPPRDAAHGDLSTNAAMVLAGQIKQKPRDIAEKIAAYLRDARGVESVDIAGPGFINIRLTASVWQSIVPVILADGTSFGNSRMGANAAVNVEYVSANPTGPMHVGHARGAVYGDALATLLIKAGYDVTREYYINDAGAQVEKVARSAYLRYREACGEVIGEMPAGLYPGDYMKAAGEAIRAAHGNALMDVTEDEWLPICRPLALDAMMALIRQDLADLGIHHNVFTSEAALQKGHKIEEAIAALNAQGLIYRGVLEPPKGKTPDDWEPREQVLFKSTDHGDDVDRPVQKSDGAFTYFAGDLALAMDKIKRGFNHQILVLGADHGGYVKRLKAAVSALSGGAASAHVILCQLVHLFQNGEPFKMSKRAGTFITVRDVLDEVGKDILRFVMLMRKNDQDMDFDLAKVKEQSKDNAVFYVQYAHARAKSVLRMAASQMPDAYAVAEKADGFDAALLSHPAELALIKLLAAWPRQVEQAAIAHEPHRIIYYLQEVAASFHGLWNVGQSDAQIRFVLEGQPAITAARLALARATTLVIASGLHVCGVQPVEELR